MSAPSAVSFTFGSQVVSTVPLALKRARPRRSVSVVSVLPFTLLKVPPTAILPSDCRMRALMVPSAPGLNVVSMV